MSTVSRRTVLAAFGAAAVPPVAVASSATPAFAVASSATPAFAVASSATPAFAADDLYGSNTELYQARTEGVEYARRFRRHAAFDDSDAPGGVYPDTVVVALHGGGIEPGTSELCLAVAGYHPATLAATGGAVHDYWIFEGIMAQDNGDLHVTSAHCDDPVAEATVGGSHRTVSLHGCSASQAGFTDPDKHAVLVGGLDVPLRTAMIGALRAAGFDARDAAGNAALAGTDPENIVNRNVNAKGVQLEITTKLRRDMFLTNTRSGRKTTTQPLFWDFVGAVRSVLSA